VYTNVGTSASGGSNTGKKGNWGVVGVESVDAGDGRGQRDSGQSATTINVYATVSGTANPVEYGQAVADALAAYYRNGGPRP